MRCGDTLSAPGGFDPPGASSCLDPLGNDTEALVQSAVQKSENCRYRVHRRVRWIY